METKLTITDLAIVAAGALSGGLVKDEKEAAEFAFSFHDVVCEMNKQRVKDNRKTNQEN